MKQIITHVYLAQRTITYIAIKISFPLDTSLPSNYKSTEKKYRTRFHPQEEDAIGKFHPPKFERVYQRAHVRGLVPKNIFESGQAVHYPAAVQARFEFETRSQTRKLATDRIAATHPWPEGGGGGFATRDPRTDIP